MAPVRKTLFPAALFLLAGLAFASCGKPIQSTVLDDGVTDVGLISVSAAADSLIPTAFLNTFARLLGPDEGGVAAVRIVNRNSVSVQFTISAVLDGYSSEAIQGLTLAPSAARTVYFNPLLTTEGFSLLTESKMTNCTLKVRVADGGSTREIFKRAYPTQMLARDVMLWTFQGLDFSPFVALWVTPHAPRIKELIGKAAEYHPDKILMGYQGSESGDGYADREYPYGDSVSIPAGGAVSVCELSFDTLYMRDIVISGNFGVSGESGGDVSARLVSGDGVVLYRSGPKHQDAFSLRIAETGKYFLYFDNTDSPRTEKTVTFSISAAFNEDLITPQVKAVYDALQKDYRIKYVNSTISFPGNGSQTIRLPGESLDYGTANCIDGAVLFASALEYIGIEPLIMLIPGHAFVGWKRWTGSKDMEFLETTMIGGFPFERAYAEGNTEYQQNSGKSNTALIDVKWVQDQGLIPLAKQASAKPR